MIPFAVMAGALFAWLAPSVAQAQPIVSETFMILAAEPGTALAGQSRGSIVLRHVRASP